VSSTQKIDRARRNAMKATGLVLGAVLATGALHKQALAFLYRARLFGHKVVVKRRV
jgi:hypothetical protein